MSDKADEAMSQARKAEQKIDKICNYLIDLRSLSQRYYFALESVNDKYMELLNGLKFMIVNLHKTDWYDYTYVEKKSVENLVLLVGLLYQMCKVTLVEKTSDTEGMNTLNKEEVNKSIDNSKVVMADI